MPVLNMLYGQTEAGDGLLTEVEVNSTLVITSELTNQRARKPLFTCVVYGYSPSDDS